MANDKLYKADNARFTIDGMNLEKVNPSERDAEMNSLFDLLDEFHDHGLSPQCENGMESHEYAFGYLKEFIYDKYNHVRQWNISNKTFQRMQPTLMANPGIFREIDEEGWQKKSGFKNDCGFQSIDKGEHYSGDVDTWHNNRETYYRKNQCEIDWNNRDAFLPNRNRSDEILRMRIDRFVEEMVKDEARRNKWAKDDYNKLFSNRCKEIKDKWDKNVGVTFHKEVMNDKNGSLKALADEVGTQICEINFYTYEDQLTKNEKKATKSQRKIFSLINKNGEKQYISIDFAHGMFEFHDKNGIHLGEYRFNGMHNSGAEPSHNFKTLRH